MLTWQSLDAGYPNSLRSWQMHVNYAALVGQVTFAEAWRQGLRPQASGFTSAIHCNNSCSLERPLRKIIQDPHSSLVNFNLIMLL